MKYFEIKHPYYALIRAKNEREAMKTYTKYIDDCKPGNYIVVSKVHDIRALEKFLNRLNDDVTLKEALEHFNKNDILLLDGTLL